MEGLEESSETPGKLKLTCDGHNWDRDKNCYVYNISVNDGAGHVKILMKSMGELMTFMHNLRSKRYCIIRRLELCDKSEFEPEDPKRFASNIDHVFEEVVKRDDIINDLSFVSFFGIQKSTQPSYLPPRLISRMRLHDGMSLSDLLYDAAKGVLIICFQNTSALSRIGRVWSLIDAEIMGHIKIMKRKSAPSKLIPDFERGCTKDFEIKPLACCYASASNAAFFGFHDGNIMVIKFNPASPEQHQVKSESILGESVLFMIPIQNDCLIISVTAIKIVTEELGVVGGGSLRKRLGSDVITSAQLDSKSNTLFLGVSNGTIIGYEIKFDEKEKVYKLNYLDTVEAKRDRNIETILYKKGHVFCAQGLDVSVWNFKDKPKFSLTNTALFAATEEMKSLWSGNNIVSLEYHADQTLKLLITGLSNGVMVLWSAKYGDIVSIIQAHYASITRMSFLEEKDVLFTGCASGEIRIWKFGEIPKDSYDEVKNLQIEY
jgi:hypothetical protein